MYPEFKIFDTIISSYNIMLLFGILFSFLFYDHKLRKDGLQNIKYYYEVIPFLIIFGLLGASVWELIFQGSNITINNLLSGGKTFYGGLIFCLLFLIPYCRWTKLDFYNLVNRLVIPVTIGHCLGRIGCFLGGCCYGHSTTAWFGVKYPSNSIPHKLYGDVSLIPTQLIESIILAILVYILLKVKNQNTHLILYLFVYGTFRFLIEFVRYDDRGSSLFSNFSPAQLISLLLIFSGTLILIFNRSHSKIIVND